MKYEYIIRTVGKDFTSYNNFQWPKSGQVKAYDFKPTSKCGNGLHGLRIGQQKPGTWYGDGIVLLLQVPASTIIDLEDNGKCKFPECKIVMSGNMNEITNYLYKKNINIEGLYRRTQLSNKSEKWIGGDFSKLTAGSDSTLTAGDFSTLTAGYRSTLTAGDRSTLTAGDYSTLICRYWDGNKYRFATAYVGENGIKPNQAYRVNNKGEFYEV